MKKNKYVLLLIVFAVAVLVVGFESDYYFKINKSFELYGEVFRQITTSYVDDIDPEQIVTAGIDAMLKTLDPYTVLLNEETTEDIDMITNGSYTGLGITVSVLDSMLTITGIQEGFPAEKAGIRIGDRIYKIDSTVVLHCSNTDLRKYTRGKPGSKLSMLILRGFDRDTLKFALSREEIKLRNVSYSGVINNNIAYIKLDRFSKNTTEEVKAKLYDLKYNYKLSGIILDLRDNPGGLLEAAISISEMFVKNGDTILTTRSRKQNDNRVYKSISTPVDAQIPLAVLINENSASASEIVAGAIQDLDRGIIVGRNSFGKGLVQSVFDLPFKYALKMTTSKYYTPSGRCIQRIDYLQKRKHNDSLIYTDSKKPFHTRHGRTVYELKGIMPDSNVVEEEYSSFVKELIQNSLVFNFATDYSSKLKTLPHDFKIDQNILNKFNDYINKKNFDYKSPLLSEIENLRSLSQKEDVSNVFDKKIDELESLVKSEKKNLIHKYSKEVTEVLYLEIMKRFYPESKIIQISLKEDRDVNAALNLLDTKNYKTKLAIRN